MRRPPATDQIARASALIGAGLPLPRDLGDWLIQCVVEGHATPQDRRTTRDTHLRAAAALLCGCPHRKAQTLRRAADRLQRRPDWRLQSFPAATVDHHLHAALLHGALPRERQLRSILSELAAEKAA